MGDALFAAEFKTIAKSGDIEALRGTIAADLAPVASSTDIEVLRGDIGQGLQMVDTSTVAAGSLAANTARSAGLMAANASRAAGAGIESTLWATRPIVNVNVDVSATTINQVSVTQDRAGAASGSRNGDGAGFGPAGR
jgi:hypothetical protein